MDADGEIYTRWSSGELRTISPAAPHPRFPQNKLKTFHVPTKHTHNGPDPTPIYYRRNIICRELEDVKDWPTAGSRSRIFV